MRGAVRKVGMEDDRRAKRAAGRKARGALVVPRKEEVVLRLLRGELLDLLACESGQPAGTIASWREEEFLAAGREGLKCPPQAHRGPRAR
jgi:hypothetical protein